MLVHFNDDELKFACFLCYVNVCGVFCVAEESDNEQGAAASGI